MAIPAADIHAVVTYAGYKGSFWSHGPGMVVLDRDDRILLRARGAWDRGDLEAVLNDLGLPRPKFLSRRDARTRRSRWARAPGYQRLRVRPRGFALYVLALVAAIPAFFGAGLVGGAQLGAALPDGFGAVRILIGIAAAGLGGVAALWLLIQGGRLVLGAIRWAAYSVQARSPAPAAPFFSRREPSGAARKLRAAAMVLAVPALIGWGPGVGIATLVNGFSDQALVTTLRQAGVPGPGLVVDVPTYSTDSDGNTTVTHHATLNFLTGGRAVLTPDPDIAGRHWPINPHQAVTVVYNPANLDQAAVRGQITGSPWHGIPTANLISSGLLTVALPFLVWRLVRFIAAGRRSRSEDFLDGIF